MRLFIAICFDENMLDSLTEIQDDLMRCGVKGNYTVRENLHMTLAFIGETQEADAVREVMKSIPVERSRLSFSEYGNFKDTMWIGIKGNQKIKKYAADLRKGLKEKGVPCDMSKFEPHVTLIRSQKGKRPEGLKVPSADMTVTKVSLMKSEMKDGKRVYREIFSVS